jgi:hypothetical protein
MYFVLHPHGLNMAGKWVGLGYDDRIMTGRASMGQGDGPDQDRGPGEAQGAPSEGRERGAAAAALHGERCAG